MGNYSLQKYKGTATRHTCPKCGDRHSFVYYVDENNVPIHPSVGRCNHESGCGYHYTPKKYYQDNPQLSEFFGTVKKDGLLANVSIQNRIPARANNPEPGRIPKQYIIQSLGYNSSFVAFLCSIFDR